MRKPKKEIQLTSYDELLGINEAEQNSVWDSHNFGSLFT